MAFMPAIVIFAQEEGITAVKGDKPEINMIIDTDTLPETCPDTLLYTHPDSSPSLSKRELHKQRVAKRNLHYNILGGPSYTPDFGVLVGGSALMTFRMNPSDTTQLRSVVPVAIAFMFKGGLNLFSKPQLFFKGDRFRIFGQFSYKNTQENFYGIGYDTNKDYVRSDTTSQYRYSGIQINPWFLFRLGESNFFVGPQIDINYDKMTKPAKYLAEQAELCFSFGFSHADGTVTALMSRYFD